MNGSQINAVFTMHKKSFIIIPLLLFITNFCYPGDKILRFQHITADNGLPNNAIDCIIQDKYGYIWIASLEGLSRFDGYKIKVFPGNPRISDTPLNNRPIAMTNDKAGNLWIAFSSEYEKVCRYNFDTDNFTRFLYSEIDSGVRNRLQHYSEQTIHSAQNKDYIWDTKKVYLTQTRKSDGSEHVYKSDTKTNWSILDEFILSLYLDKQNVLWIGTDNGGVSFADIDQPDFSFYSFQNNTVNDMKESTIRAIYKSPKNELWIGTRNNGFVKINSSTNKNLTYRNDPTNKNSLINNSVRKIYPDSHGNIWIGTKGGLDKFDPKTNTFEHYLFDFRKHAARNWIFSVFEDREGILWAGTWLGLARYDRKNDRFINYFPSGRNNFRHIRDIIQDQKGNLWVGTEGFGLSCVKKKMINGKLQLVATHYLNQTENENSLQDDWVYCLCEDSLGKIWIGTGSGLNRLDPVTRQFTRFKNHNFLSERIIHGILYEKGSVWVSHQNGLTEINCKTLSTRDFTKQNDLYENEFSEDAYFKNPATGELFFGGNRGFISFYPDKINKSKIPPRVVFTDLKIANKSIQVNQVKNNRIILQHPLYLTKEIKLKWAEHSIQVEFAALYFSNPKNVKYAYRLKGLDNNWVITGANARTAIFPNLNAGRYLLEVKAANPDGVWSQKPATLSIIILPPWWQTWWAYCLYILIGIVIIYFVMKYVLDRQKFIHDLNIERIRAEKIKEMDELKTKFFTNISHEFRTPLTLIIDPVQKLLQNKSTDQRTLNYYNLIARNAHRLLELINQFLDLKKAESGNLVLNPTYHDFVMYIKSLSEYFDLHARLHNIELKFETNSEKQFAYFDTEKMDKIILNLLTNAFKNTPVGGSITIKLNIIREFSMIEISIIDSGSGIPEELLDKIFDPFFQVENQEMKNSSGIGLALVKELVEMHKGTVTAKSEKGNGSTFKLTLPILCNEVDAHPEEKIIDHNFISLDSSDKINSIENPNEQKTDLPTILVIEDNTDVRNYLVNEINDIFNTVTAIDGNDGWDKAIEIIPDLILTDIMMPGINGFELCKKIKTDERTSHIPVVLLTAQQSDEYRISGYETGADAYITKPFNSTLIRFRIINLLESRKRLRRLFNKNTGFDTDIIAINNVDKIFLDKLVAVIQENMSSPTFDIEELASRMNLSRTQLYRKIKNLTDKSAQEFVSTIKLNKAAELILTGMYNITQVSEMVGSSEVGNFTRSFVRQFGVSPKVYKNTYLKKQNLN